MNLDAIFETAIAGMDSATKTVQETIRIRPWIGEDMFGKIQRGATRKIKGVVDRHTAEIRTRDGRVLGVRAIITFLQPIAAVGVAGRQEPIDPRDEVFLADDMTGPIVSIQGSTNNPSTKTRYFQRVALG